jgi:hypothetical protein
MRREKKDSRVLESKEERAGRGGNHSETISIFNVGLLGERGKKKKTTNINDLPCKNH